MNSPATTLRSRSLWVSLSSCITKNALFAIHCDQKVGVTAITSFEQFQEIINGDRTAVIDFWATWCGPCKMVSPIFEKLSEALPNLDFYKVDVDEQERISEEVGIKAMPTFVAFKKGEKTGSIVGADPNKLKNGLEMWNNDA